MEATVEIAFQIEPPDSPTARGLVSESELELKARYPDHVANEIDPTDFKTAGGVFVVGYLKECPIACGSFLPFGDVVELKRIFVTTAFRRKGCARQMLAFLEREAAARGFKRAVLETGQRQPEALSLYPSAGWIEIERFEPYINTVYSVCFGKDLKRPSSQ